MTPFAQAFSAALLHFVWQGTLAAVLLWIALAFLKNRSANARYLASSLALALMAASPICTTWLLYRRAAPIAPGATFASGILPAAAALPRLAAGSFDWLALARAWALPFWIAGVFVFSLRLAWGCRQVSLMRRAGEPAAEWIQSLASGLSARLGLFFQVRIVVTARSESPSVVGWLRPVILLPAASLMGLSAEQLEAVLAHEFAHIRRHDYLVNLLQNLVETVLFYHPAVWWTSSRMRHERELCCDDLAVQSCGSAVCYARALTEFEKLRTSGASLAMASTGGSLLYRIQRLMGLRPAEAGPSRLAAAAAVLLGIACIAVNLHNARAQEIGFSVRSNQNEIGEKLEGIAGIVGSVPASDGPGVQVDAGTAKILERVGVEYPGSAWEHQIGGLVIAEATLNAEGTVDDARILSGPAELRKSVLQSLLEWRFAPAPTGTTLQVSVKFDWQQAQQKHAEEPKRALTVMKNGVRYSFNMPDLPPDTDLIRNEMGRVALSLPTAELTQADKRLHEIQSEALEHGQRVVFPAGTEGRTVTRIFFNGVPAAEQSQIAGTLPVHLGDKLTSDLNEGISSAITKVDPGLMFLSVVDDKSNNVQIVILKVQ